MTTQSHPQPIEQMSLEGDMKTPSLDTAIQSLPPELREMILKELINTQLKERQAQGWDAVHAELATEETEKKIRCLICRDRMVLSREVQTAAALSDICEDCWSDCISFQEGNAEEDPRWPSWL